MFNIKEKSFTRRVPLLDAVILGIGSTIGAGIFLLLSSGIETAGPAVLLAFLINALLALVIAGNYAEAATYNPIDGGGFSFVEEAYGKRALFIGWIVWLGNTSYAALTSVGIGQYLSQLLPVNSVVIGIVFLLLFTLLNCIGSKSVSSVEKPLTITLVIVLLLFSAYLFLNPVDGGFTPFFSKGVTALLPATSLLFITFTGFEAITTISAEIKKPTKNIPKALFYTIIIVSIVYLLIAGSCLYSTNETRLRQSTIALVEAVQRNELLEGFIMMSAVIAMVSSLNVGLMAGARNVYALSRDDFLPKSLGEINEKLNSPVKATFLTFGVATLLILTNRVDLIASVTNIAFMLVVSTVGVSVFKFRKKSEKKNKRNYKVPFFPFTSYLCVIAPLILIPFLEFKGIIIGFTWFIIGVLIHLFRSRGKWTRSS